MKNKKNWDQLINLILFLPNIYALKRSKRLKVSKHTSIKIWNERNLKLKTSWKMEGTKWQRKKGDKWRKKERSGRVRQWYDI